MSIHERAIADFLQRCKTASVALIEWEIALVRRLNYPLVTSPTLIFLVPDSQLEKARTLAHDAGLLSVDKTALPPSFLSEYPDQVARFAIKDAILDPGHPMLTHRLVLLSMSYAGLTMKDVVPISDASAPANYTIPLPAACAAFVRLVIKERGSPSLTAGYLELLAGVICYTFFDMSYEGAYLDIPGNDVPLSAAEREEIDNAARQMSMWEFRPDEVWMKDLLVRIVRTEAKYDDILLMTRDKD